MVMSDEFIFLCKKVYNEFKLLESNDVEHWNGHMQNLKFIAISEPCYLLQLGWYLFLVNY